MVVIDELATLQRLPQFHTALTKGRKSNNPIIFGYQGKAQLEVIYGHLAEVMLSMPSTKIVMKTSEPSAAKWASELIGEIEIERVRATVADGKRAGKSFTMDRQIEPLVMASEIEGFDDLQATAGQPRHPVFFSPTWTGKSSRRRLCRAKSQKRICGFGHCHPKHPSLSLSPAPRRSPNPSAHRPEP